MKLKNLVTALAVISLVSFALLLFSPGAKAVEVDDPLIKEWLDIVG